MERKKLALLHSQLGSFRTQRRKATLRENQELLELQQTMLSLEQKKTKNASMLAVNGVLALSVFLAL